MSDARAKVPVPSDRAWIAAGALTKECTLIPLQYLETIAVAFDAFAAAEAARAEAAEALVGEILRGGYAVNLGAGQNDYWAFPRKLYDRARALLADAGQPRCQCGRVLTVEKRAGGRVFAQCERRATEVGHDSVDVTPADAGQAGEGR